MRTPFIRYFDTVGDLSGSKLFNINASGGIVRASLSCPEDELTVITSLRVVVSDTDPMDSGKYGNGLTLVNGINLILETNDNTLIFDYSTGGPDKVLTNGDYINWGLDVDYVNFGQGKAYMSATLSNVTVKMEYGQKLSWILNDDFSLLNSHSFLARGYTYPDTFKYRQLFKDT